MNYRISSSKMELFNYRTMDGEAMSDNSFFKPALLYKEFMILDLIEKNANITQREIGKTIGVAVSMVNGYLDEYEKKGFIKRKYHSTKTVEYNITKKGLEQRKLLNIRYLKSSHMVYLSAKDNIVAFLAQIADRGFHKILLYGAGEVAEIMLQSMVDDFFVLIEAIAVIDDDLAKQGKKIVGLPIIGIDDIGRFDHDGILISSYTHHHAIRGGLLKTGYPENKIIEFFS